MHQDELVRLYLEALGAGDAVAAVALFAPGGTVESPLYGTMSAEEFYPALFADTAQAVLRLRKTMAGEGTIAFWFDFDWVLADGTPARFTVVDVAQLDDRRLIETLHIVYDTFPVRSVWEQARAPQP